MEESLAKNANIFIISLGSFFTFAAFFTIGNIQV